MGTHLTVLTLGLFVAALAGHLIGGWPSALVAVTAASLAHAGLDAWLGQRFTRWLRDLDAAPPRGGRWGEAAHRVHRLLRREQRRTQEQAERSNQVLAAIHASPNGVVLLDPQGRIEWFNHTAGQHLGLLPQRDEGQHLTHLVRDPAFVAYSQARCYDTPVHMLGHQHSAEHPLHLSVQIHPCGQGRHLLLSTDITALARAEAMRRDFVANVSHEIRTPLTVLVGFIETMQTLPLPEAERQQHLGLMQAQAARMRALVDDLLTLSRLEGSPPPGTDETIDLLALMQACEDEAMALSELLNPDQPQILDFAPCPNIRLHGSAQELRSAITNLVSNAVRYTPPGGRIRVVWQRLGDGKLRLQVQDSGPGIAAEHLPRLTERFYRIERSRTRESGGTGLGLAIVKHVAQRHGGRLDISSTPGQGSCFSLHLPAWRVRQSKTQLF